MVRVVYEVGYGFEGGSGTQYETIAKDIEEFRKEHKDIRYRILLAEEKEVYNDEGNNRKEII